MKRTSWDAVLTLAVAILTMAHQLDDAVVDVCKLGRLEGEHSPRTLDRAHRDGTGPPRAVQRREDHTHLMRCVCVCVGGVRGACGARDWVGDERPEKP